MTEQPDRIAARARLLALRAAELEIEVTADDRVSERGLACLLGIEAETLARMRADGDAPAFFRLPAGHRSKISYDLSDAAEWIEGMRECPACRRHALDR